MNGFLLIWEFTRERLEQAWSDLTPEQLHWRMNDEAMTIAEMLLHIASAEHYMGHRMRGEDPRATAADEQLDRAVTDSFLNDLPYPFSKEEMTKEFIHRTLAKTAAEVRPVIEKLDKEMLERRFISPLGPEIDGLGGLQRICQHSAYHTGQIWQIRLSPGFPAG